jgi:hypothetical protein
VVLSQYCLSVTAITSSNRCFVLSLSLRRYRRSTRRLYSPFTMSTLVNVKNAKIPVFDGTKRISQFSGFDSGRPGRRTSSVKP